MSEQPDFAVLLRQAKANASHPSAPGSRTRTGTLADGRGCLRDRG